MGHPRQHAERSSSEPGSRDDRHRRSPHEHRWVALDGTGLHAPPGRLERDPDTGNVCCHVCGEYFRALGSHVRAHGYSAAEYRRVMELCRTQALAAADVSASISRRQKSRFATSMEHRQQLAPGRQMARDGRLTQLARLTGHSARPLRVARDTALARGRATSSSRRASARSERLETLGIVDLGAWLRRTYGDGASIEDLARTLGIGRQGVRHELVALGIDIRPTGANSVLGKRSRAAVNDECAAARVGTGDITGWLRHQRSLGHSLTELAHMVGHSTHWVRWRLDAPSTITPDRPRSERTAGTTP